MKQGARLVGIGLVLTLVGMALFCALSLIWNFGDRRPELMLLGIGVEVVLYLAVVLGPVGRAIGKLLEGNMRESTDDLLLARLSDIEYRLGEISGEVHRVGELDSRIEFAERMLVRPTSDFSREER